MDLALSALLFNAVGNTEHRLSFVLIEITGFMVMIEAQIRSNFAYLLFVIIYKSTHPNIFTPQ